MGDVSVRTKFSVLLLLFMYSIQVNAASIVFTGFDNALVETRSEYGGSFNTHYILYRVDKTNPIQDSSKGPEVVLVTMQELKQIRDGLAKSTSTNSFIPGSLESFKLSSGERIRVGEYAFIPGKSLIYFEASNIKGRNYLLESFQLAESQGSVSKWQGPMWATMVELLNDKRKTNEFGLITERGHSQREWEEFFNYLIERKYIRFLPNFKNIHSLSNPEYTIFGKTISDRKANLISHLAMQGLGRAVLTDSDISISRNGDSSEKVHKLIYAEESREGLDAVIERLEKITTGRYTEKSIKFVVVNTGSESEVKASGRPRVSVLRSDDGTVRAIIGRESSTEFPLLKFRLNSSYLNSNKLKTHSCQGLFK